MTGEGTRHRVRLPGTAIAALVLLVLAVASVAPAWSTYLAQQRTIADAEARVAAQKAELGDLAAQRARWDDPAYVRAQAGSRLFYVLPGTRAYRVINGRATPTATSTPATTVQPARTAWPAALLDSLVTAGTTSDTPEELSR